MSAAQKFEPVWKDQYTIHSYQVDMNNNATLVVLCQLMQESAWNHAEHLELGFSHLNRKNFIWVLRRQLVKMYSFPKWGDSIEVYTWPTAKDNLFCYRDFRISDSAGSVIGEATTSWFVIELTSRKPQRTDSYFHVDLTQDVEPVFPGKLDKLQPPTSTANTRLIQVTYGDLDRNEHVNNVRYIDWILNGLPFDYLRTHELKEMEVNYLSEASYDDEILVRCEKKEASHFFHSLIRKKDNTELCRARTAWESMSK
jgi:acyl-ACP thioesterase